jgi:hypothetical protein
MALQDVYLSSDQYLTDDSGASMSRRVVESVRDRDVRLTEHKHSLLPNMSLRQLLVEAAHTMTWMLDCLSSDVGMTRLYTEISLQNRVRGLGVIMALFGLAGCFLWEAM